MATIKNPFKALKIKLIYLVLLFSFGLHMIVAALPGNLEVSDEYYYVTASIDTLHGIANNFEHTPLVKIIIALFIAGLGNNWIAWRLPIVLSAVLATYMTYKIAGQFLSERASLFAAVLLSLSVIFMWMGSLAMLDVPCVALGLAGIYFALRNRYGLSGLMFGLSFLCKELGILMFIATFIYLAVKKIGGWRILFYSCASFTTSFCGLWLYDVTYRPTFNGVVLANPVEQIYYMVLHYALLERTHMWYPPISWVTPFGANALNPLHLFYWEINGKLFAQWIMQPNAAIEYLTIPMLISLPILYIKRKDALAILSWLWITLAN